MRELHRICGWAALWAGLAAGTGCDGAEPVVPTGWETSLVELRGCRQGIEHDLEYVRLLADADSENAFEQCTVDPDACSDPFPEGALFVKPQYADPDCTDLVRISAVRRERAAAAPGPEGWRWQELTPDLRVEIDGEPASCLGCHEACEGFDTRCAMDP